MIRAFTVLAILFFSQCLMAQIDISEARSMPIGAEVTIVGVATNGGELGIIRYLQDETGGIAVYPGTGTIGDFPDDVAQGDLVEVTGPLKEFNGLLEVDPVLSYNIISSNNPMPDPIAITPSEITEETEALLVSIEGATFVAGGNTFSVGSYDFTANGETGELFVRSNHPLIGEEIPLAKVNLTGIGSQFNSIYQILLRDLDDIEIADDFFFTSAPAQTGLTQEGFDVRWQTNNAGSSIIKYGTSPDNLSNTIEIEDLTTEHEVSLTGLEPASFYYVQVCSDNGSSTVSSAIQLYSTASNSSGDMKIYFNHNVDGSLSSGSFADGYTGATMEAEIIKRIEAAESTIDAAIYNVNRDPIIAALNAAHERGVVVRYIADNETANLALADAAADFPVIRGNSEGLMHNKFLVFDANSTDNAWLMSGSTNLTEQNIATDFNNMIFIQDVSLAKAYTIEFEEMWGSTDPTPGVFSVQFGPDKRNNTPHTFLINGTTIESFFSPSDNTTIAIAKAIQSAQDELQFAILSFTNNELGDAVLDAHNSGVEVRGIIDNINDQGAEFDYLMGQGVNVSPDNNTKQTHHKYAIVDGNSPGSDPQVVVGSHNWSAGAETRNDENTLIIHSASFANVFLQEFEARWCEVMGGNACTTAIQEQGIDGVEVSVFPNPTSAFANVSLDFDKSQQVVMNLLNSNGQLLQSTIKQVAQGPSMEQIDLSNVAAGVYYVQLKSGKQQLTKRITVVK